MESTFDKTMDQLNTLYESLYEQDAPYYTAPSDIHGKGIHARNPMTKGETVGRATTPYSDGETIPITHMGKHINHSWNPNCVLNKIVSNDKAYYDMNTVRDVDKDEELTVDYSEYEDFKNPSPFWEIELP